MEKKYINWVVDELYGWRGKVNGFKYDHLKKEIESGKELPAVHVIHIGENVSGGNIYQISFTRKRDDIKEKLDGAHGRAKVHYDLNEALEIIIDSYASDFETGMHKPRKIREIKPDYSDFQKMIFENIKKVDKNYK